MLRAILAPLRGIASDGNLHAVPELLRDRDVEAVHAAIGGNDGANRKNRIAQIGPVGRETVAVVSIMGARIGGEVVPLHQHEITLDIRREAKRVLMHVMTKEVVLILAVVLVRDVRSVGVVEIFGGPIHEVPHEFQGVLLEAIVFGNLALLDGAGVETEMALVMSRQSDLAEQKQWRENEKSTCK